jgi:hypothetical protein
MQDWMSRYLRSQKPWGAVMSKVQEAFDIGNNPVLQTTSSTGFARGSANESFFNRKDPVRKIQSRLPHIPVFHLLVLLFVYCCWQYGGYFYITPEQGIGYALGITGGTMMLLLMLYPLRKHARWAQGLGPVRHWFRVHMLLGVMGPVCILLHCNFQLGSINGNVALFSMLLVAGSGLVGRFIYSKVHYGLYGRKADLANLGSDTALAMAELGPVFREVPVLKGRLQRIGEKAVATRNGFLGSLLGMLVISASSRWCLLVSLPELRRFFNSPVVRERLTREHRRYYHRKAGYYLRTYLYTVRKVAGFSFFERLFSMWHILHMPLFVMLLIAGIVHVYAVHMY